MLLLTLLSVITKVIRINQGEKYIIIKGKHSGSGSDFIAHNLLLLHDVRPCLLERIKDFSQASCKQAGAVYVAPRPLLPGISESGRIPSTVALKKSELVPKDNGKVTTADLALRSSITYKIVVSYGYYTYTQQSFAIIQEEKSFE